MTHDLITKFQNTPEGTLLQISLNSPQSLNALSISIIRKLKKALITAKEDSSIKVIWLESGIEKAFCAGGDIRALHSAMVEGEYTRCDDFFKEEYELNLLIHTFPKPIIVWAAGLVFGGGLGVAVGCSHRIVTETTKMGMPELGIGLFPDVGASWFLNRIPQKIGLFLGLTGSTLLSGDALKCGLADYVCPNASKSQIFESLLKNSNSLNVCGISRILQNFDQRKDANYIESKLYSYFPTISLATKMPSLEKTLSSLKALASPQDRWLQKIHTYIETSSPLSQVIFWEQYHRARFLSLSDCFAIELKLAKLCVRYGDFKEGIRALLIDKDKNPQWTHKSINDVEREEIHKCFY